jgi:hypothetical protein
MTMPQRCSCRWMIPVQAPYEAPPNGQNLPAESVPQNTKPHVYPLSRFERKWVVAELREHH